MKKACVCIVLIVAAFVITACAVASSENENPFERRFIYYPVDNTDRVLVDTETGVCYLWVVGGTGTGLTVMLEPDGSPLIYREAMP